MRLVRSDMQQIIRTNLVEIVVVLEYHSEGLPRLVCSCSSFVRICIQMRCGTYAEKEVTRVHQHTMQHRTRGYQVLHYPQQDSAQKAEVEYLDSTLAIFGTRADHHSTICSKKRSWKGLMHDHSTVLVTDRSMISIGAFHWVRAIMISLKMKMYFRGIYEPCHRLCPCEAFGLSVGVGPVRMFRGRIER